MLQTLKIPMVPPDRLVPIIHILNNPATNEFWALDQENSFKLVMLADSAPNNRPTSSGIGQKSVN